MDFLEFTKQLVGKSPEEAQKLCQDNGLDFLQVPSVPQYLQDVLDKKIQRNPNRIIVEGNTKIVAVGVG